VADAIATAAYEGTWRLSCALQSGGGDAGHWSRMPKSGAGYAARSAARGALIRLSRVTSVPDNGPVLEMTREEFEELVAEALDRIPPELTRLMDNVAVFVEDEPPSNDPELLGLYEGTPLTDRGEWYAGVLPDRITIYRGPTLRMCETREDVVAETEVTVVHEIAHHFGIDDARLHALGYG
jgi:predicted Zn-dependent protease with MMP-like domain